ncbi:Broad specificity phosphatase PhoE [Geosmithia morbida]|uniref:Broad specificity phosphatase PhoE n=1 Tax=Geosmithia morbida TaxID=1094350 RepID=A0A9P5D349_9HYPO|nr:Broad specificity phosphatase PhoE [Geosmithia morbida]KAF4125808.1 Broad specificity phosphatase PhoE [Geosmithia morbida]
MAKPRLIILVRHAQSEGNKNRDIHQTVPDHRVKLTQDGWSQAYEAGRRLRGLLRPDDKIHFFTSPYRRTRETTEGMLSTLTSDEPGPSPFRRSNIKVYEEPRLREQDFGNFQPCSAEMERMWQERADYGHFFYRIPNGESAADAYDRVSGFNESLWRQFGEDDFASVCVLVTHGLMSRVFLMKWYHFTVEYFEDLRNVNHCEFLIMRKQDNGKYFLENNLRTWSDLRRERALREAAATAASATPSTGTGTSTGTSTSAGTSAGTSTSTSNNADAKDKDKDKDRDANGLVPAGPSPNPRRPVRQRTIHLPRQWGGCPNGCNHSRHHISKRDDLELLRQKDTEHAAAAVAASPATATTTASSRKTPPANGISSDEGGADSSSASEDRHHHSYHHHNHNHHSKPRPADISQQAIKPKFDAGGEPILSSPDFPPDSPSAGHAQHYHSLNVIGDDTEGHDADEDDNATSSATGGHAKAAVAGCPNNNDDDNANNTSMTLLHVGRDFGGSYSGRGSSGGSDTEASDDDGDDDNGAEHHHKQKPTNAHVHHNHRVASLNTRIRIANAKSLQHRLEKDPKSVESAGAAAVTATATATATVVPPLGGGDKEVTRPGGMETGHDSEFEGDGETLEKLEAEDRSIRGSVY